MKVSGAVFDVDGTLVDSEHFQFLAWAKVLEPFGARFLESDWPAYSGKDAKATSESITKRFGLRLEKHALYYQRLPILLELLRNDPLKPMPYAVESLEFFKRRGIPLAFATAPQEETMIKLNKTNLAHYFQAMVFGGEVSGRYKPFPDIYLLAAKKLGVSPSDCLAFEDSEMGVASAKSAGMFTIAVPTQYSASQDFSKADRVFQNLKEAVDWVSANFGF